LKGFLALVLIALAGLGALLLIRPPGSSAAEFAAGSRLVAGAEHSEVLPELVTREKETRREEVSPGAGAQDPSGPSAHPACTLEGSIRNALGEPTPSAWVHLKDELGGEEGLDRAFEAWR